MEYKGVRIPDTPDGWELYDTPGAAKAAEALAQASKEAVDMIADARVSNFRTTVQEAVGHIYKVCDKHAKDGAADSEGLYHARHVVVRAAKTLADIEVDPWEL